MKKFLFAALLVFTPATAMAQDAGMVQGSISASAGYNDYQGGDYVYESSYGQEAGTNDTKLSGPAFELRGSFAVPVTGSIGAQIDGAFGRTNAKRHGCGGCDTLRLEDSTAAVHLFIRNPDKGLVGIVGQRSTRTFSYGFGQTTYYVGGEAQLYVNRATVSAQAVYGAPSYNNSSYDAGGAFVTVGAAVYPKDNLKLGLRGTYAKLDYTPNENSGYNCPDYCSSQSSRVWSFGGLAEYRLPRSGISLFVKADYREFRDSNAYRSGTYFSNGRQDSSSVRAMFGIKLQFGSNSLIASDRSGASVSPVEPIDNVLGGERGGGPIGGD